MRHQVTENDIANALGSGDVPVLSTPRLIAWMEAATVLSAAPFVARGQTTVGVSVRVRHRRPTPVGGVVNVVAAPPAAPEGKRLTFAVRATDATGELVAEGEIERVIVDRDRFIAGLA